MEYNNLNRENGGEPESMDIKVVVEKFISRWRWFAVSIPLCLLIAFLVCQSRVPVYNVTGKVMISDSKKGELGSNVMMKELGLSATDMFVENEIVELQSKNLLREVVKELDLNIRYFREGFLRDRELYDSSPVKVLVDNPTEIRDTSFYVTLDTANVVILSDLDGKEIWSGHYSESVSMGDYHLSIERNREIASREKIRVDLSDYRKTTDRFSKNLNVQILVKNTNSVLVSLKDAVPARGIAIINTLVKRYNRNGIDNKRIVSEATVEFINERLDVINQELGSIERSAENFKKTNRLTDITSDAAFVMGRKKQSEAELLKLQTELDVLRSIHAAITQKRVDEFTLLPENLGLSDEGLNAGIARYNEMVLRRGKLLQSASESNPIVMGLNTQLRELKKNIQETISNVESSLLIKLKSVEKENTSVNKMLNSVPTQEKQFRAIARQQELKENLFLFLMQKREEAEIAKLIYVATAKRKVFGKVGIDMIAGPSEILVLADGGCDPAWVAADLLSQAEHDKLASPVLVTDSADLAKAVQAELEVQIPQLPRAAIARASVDDNGKIIVCTDLHKAIEACNIIAPEHLEVCVEDPFGVLNEIKNAGSIFLGRNVPEALGDYFAGPNHTLPTSGTARFSSPLGVDDFVKKSSFLYYTREALGEVAPRIADFAEREGLHAHAKSVTIRYEK